MSPARHDVDAGRPDGSVLEGRMPVIAVALLATGLCWVALSWSGALEVLRGFGLPDPGVVTQWGLPTAKVVRDLAAAVAIGSLLLLSTCLPRATTYPKTPAFSAILRAGVAASAAWSIASLVLVLLTYSDIIGRPAWRLPPMELWVFVRDFPLGQSLAGTAVLTALTSASLAVVRTVTWSGIAVVALLGALWAQAVTGHTAGSSDHDVAIVTLFVHVLAAAIWVGGLLTLVVAHRHLGADRPVLITRFSAVATICVLGLAVTGVVTGAVNLGSWSALLSPYGVLLAAKTVTLACVVLVGSVHRRSVARAVRLGSGNVVLRLVAVELVLIAVAVGVAVALSRSPGTGGVQASSPAEALLGFALPPPLDLSGWITSWRVDPLYGGLAVLAVLGYGVGVRRLRSRGDRWPVGRAVSWLWGCVLLLWATNGAPGVYGEVLFSMHMVQHMTVATAVPVFLVLGAPVTLALRTIPARSDGSRGAREWLLLIVNSRPAHVVGHPATASASFIVSLVAFYYSGLFELSLRSHTAHVLMIAHFLITGYLFASAIVGIDPGPRRPPHLARLLLLMITFGFHALFSVTLMSLTQVLAVDWFAGLGRSWGADLARDQYVGASIGWALGDYPLGILAVALVVSWIRSDRRDGERYERQAERDGYSELDKYNAHLRALARSAREERG